ncbi:MAG: glycine dehydrogenase (aminomethyl-transferring), partial [Planctomycetota bacterium]
MTTSFFDHVFPRTDRFVDRHLGPRTAEVEAMLAALELDDLDGLVRKALPNTIRWNGQLDVPAGASEAQAITELSAIAATNEVWRSYLGMGYHGTITPPVILRNILENPGWYTQYTPYQAEISQGRLEALLNYQTVVLDLTGMDCANASLLDEATAAAEAMTMFHRVLGTKAEGKHAFLVSDDCHPQTLDVLRTRAEPLGLEVR